MNNYSLSNKYGNLKKIINNVIKKEETVMRNTFLKFVTLLAFGLSTLMSGNALAHDNKQYTIGFAAANLQADFFNFIKESVKLKPLD